MSAATFSYDFTGHGTGPESGRSFWMSQNSLTRAFSLAPPPRAADLLDVFGAVSAADRRSKRCFRGVATGQRRICIQMPVREPEVWTSPELVTRLLRCCLGSAKTFGILNSSAGSPSWNRIPGKGF